jgi:hypothetical protein
MFEVKRGTAIAFAAAMSLLSDFVAAFTLLRAGYQGGLVIALGVMAGTAVGVPISLSLLEIYQRRARGRRT